MMELLELEKIDRKDSPIHYINEYHGILQYRYDGDICSCPIGIVIEKTAFGTLSFRVDPDQDAPGELHKKMDSLIEFVNEKYKDGYFQQ